MTQRTQSELFLVLCTLIWAATFPIAKLGLHDASPIVLITLRFWIALVILYPFCRAEVLTIDRKTARRGAILGILLFGGFLTQTVGLHYTTASKSAFITGLLVVFTPIFQLILEAKAPKTGNIIGVILVSGGLYLLTAPQGAGFNRGDAWTLGAAMLYALYIVYLDMITRRHSFMQLTFLQILVTALLASSSIYFLEEPYLYWTRNLLLALAYLAILATLLALYLITKHQRQTTPTRSAVIFSLEPLFAAIFSYFILGEKFGKVALAGGSLILAGLLVSELSDVLFKKK
jgi:drug/metabolite transporter (DMT)-like permease